MKKLIAPAALTVLKIWASVWLTFLVSMIPLYILRGQSFASPERKDFFENLIMALVGLAVGFLFLMLLQRGTDRAERMTFRESFAIAGMAAGIYFLLTVLLWVIGRNNYIFAGCLYHLECLFGTSANARPTLLGMLLGSLLGGAGQFGALVLGSHLAKRRRMRFLKK